MKLPHSRSYYSNGILALFLFLPLLAGSCSEKSPGQHGTPGTDYLALGEKFARALTGREYEKAYAMTSGSYKTETSLPAMKREFEAIVPLDWGETEPIAASLVRKKWPAMAPRDVAMVYVSIYGDVYSEAVTVVVSEEKGQSVIRTV